MFCRENVFHQRRLAFSHQIKKSSNKFEISAKAAAQSVDMVVVEEEECLN
jgi:hypothetical protein